MDEVTPHGFLDLLTLRKGHFLLESGHHGELWMDLETLFLRPRLIEPFTAELAEQVSALKVDAVCGPLVEGAFAALMVANRLDVACLYTERYAPPQIDGLFPVSYHLPATLRDQVQGKRVAIVNDVINAGSAVRGTYADLVECGADPIAMASFLVLGDSIVNFAASKNVRLLYLTSLPNPIWTQEECPLCAEDVALERAAEMHN